MSNNLLVLLKKLEWSYLVKGQLNGDGPFINACPICWGIDPSDKNKKRFVVEAHGHRDDCALSQQIKSLLAT